MKKPASKVAELAQIQPKSQFLFHKNLPPRDFSLMTLCVAYAHNKALSSLDSFRLSKPYRQSTNTIQREPTISDYMRKEFGESLLNVTKRKNKPHQVCT